MTALVIAAVFAVALAAFVTEGALGFGGTVIVACVGAQLAPLEVLLPAFVPINIALSAYLVARGAPAIAWRVLAREVAPPVGAGALVGLALFRALAEAGPAAGAALAAGFGGFVMALAVLQLTPARARGGALSRTARVALLVAGGLAHGMFGTGGPMIVYVVGRRLTEPRAFRATLAVLWLVLNAALLASFAAQGLYAGPTWTAMGALALALAPGLVLGERLHRRLPPERFARAVWGVLFVAGAALAVRSVWTLVA